MGKITRYEFLGGGGSRLLFFILCISIICIPFAIIYFKERIVRVEEEIDDPTEFLEEFRSGEVGHKPRI